MRLNVIARLEKQAEFYDTQASKIRKMLEDVRLLLSQPMVALVPRRQYRRRTQPEQVEVANRNGHAHATRKSKNGKGIGTALLKALKAEPGLTPSQLWDRIEGKFTTSSASPRGLLNVELQRLKKGGKAVNDNGQWRLT